MKQFPIKTDIGPSQKLLQEMQRRRESTEDKSPDLTRDRNVKLKHLEDFATPVKDYQNEGLRDHNTLPGIANMSIRKRIHITPIRYFDRKNNIISPPPNDLFLKHHFNSNVSLLTKPDHQLSLSQLLKDQRKADYRFKKYIDSIRSNSKILHFGEKSFRPFHVN